ncbi:hypothetical protein N9Y42_08545, partial [Mariniblastus sp.]|nr:hypothetical protein [Mariniblastus sp.]
FDGLLAAGGFKISAVRKDGKTQFISIESFAGEPCRLKTDLVADRIEGVAEQALKKQVNGVLEIDLKRGEQVVLYAAGVDPNIAIEPVDALPEDCNTFGMPKSQK